MRHPLTAPARRWRSPSSSLAAVVLQVAVFPTSPGDGVVPNLVPARRGRRRAGPRPAVRRRARLRRRPAARPRAAGRPLAGRWALALVVVGYVAGRVRQDAGADRGRRGRDRRRRRRSSARRSSRSPGCVLRRPGRRSSASCCGSILVAVLWDVLLAPFVLPRADARCSAGSSPTGPPCVMAADRRRATQEPAAAGRRPGAGLLAVRDPVRPALVPPGRRRRGLPRPGRRPSRSARSSSSPQRGLIVDDQGRPLVANRTLVGGLGRPHPARQAGRARARDAARTRLAAAVDAPPAGSAGGWSPAATPAACAGDCWNGSPYQPVPVAADVAPAGRAADPRAARGLSRRARRAAERARLPAAVRHQRSPTCSATSARSPSDELRPGRARTATRSVNGASRRSAGPASRRSTTAWLRGMPGYQQVAVDSMGRVLGDDGEVAGQPGDTLVTSIDAKVQGVVEQQLADDDQDRPRRPTTRSPTGTTSPTPAPRS